MKRKILFAVSCIGVFSIGAIIYADLAFCNTTSMLSDQEMAESFGKDCEPCTLGEDYPLSSCLTGACPKCEDWTSCPWEVIGTGNYVYNCKNTGIEDGVCYESGLVDCYQLHSCKKIGAHYPDESCNGDYCDPPAAYMGCVNCVKGEPKQEMQQQMNKVCVCG